MTRPTLRTVRRLAWRAPLGALLGLLTAVPVLAIGMALLLPLGVTDPDMSPYAVFFSAIARFVLFTGSGIVGLLLALAVVAVLHAQERPSLLRALGRSFRRAPVALAALALQMLYSLVTFVGAPVFVLAAAARFGVWERRRRTAGEEDLDRILARRSAALVDMVPFLAFLRSLAQLALTLPSAVLRPGSPRKVLRRSRVHAQGHTLSGLLFLAAPLLLNAGLTHLALPAVTAVLTGNAATSTAGLLATGALLGMCVLGAVTFGAFLGAFARRTGIRLASVGTPGTGSSAPRRSARLLLRWRPSRAAGVATMVVAALVAATLQSPSAYAAVEGDIVVDTLTDSLTPAAGECQAGATCSLRGALAYAGSGALPTPLAITFTVSGTITTLGILEVPPGITLDGHDGIVLDAGGSHGVIRVSGGDEGLVTLSHLRVVNGRTATAGAGLYAGDSSVLLDHVQFSSNVSGVQGDVGVNGGAVAAPYSQVTVRSSTFDHNIALSGHGGAVSAVALDWTNSTSYADKGVEGDPTGGAIHARNGGTVLHASVVAGGGIAGDPDYPLSVVNSLVAPSNAVPSFPCQYVTSSTDMVPSVGNVDVSGMCGVTLQADPGPLGPLADNGGPTQTVALLNGSEAIGAADEASCALLDQRGRTRTATSCDAGAFEVSAGDAKATVTFRTNGSDSINAYAMARVEVPVGSDPSGSLQLVSDGADVGSPVAVTVADDGYSGNGTVNATLTPGRHVLAVRFTPTSAAVAANTSAAAEYYARVDPVVSVSSPTPTLVGSAAVLTATVAPPAGVTQVPTGEIVLTNGPDEEVLALVDGSASWSVPVLLRGNITAAYRGSNSFRATTSVSSVTSSDLPSTTDLTLASTSPSLGTKVTGTVGVTGGGIGAYGRVVLAVDGVDRFGADVVAGSATVTLDTANLSVGPHTAVLRYIGEPGWTASSDTVVFEVQQAAIGVTLAVAQTTITWGDDATAAVEVSSARDGVLTLELVGGSDVLATKQVTVFEGRASTSFSLLRVVRPMTGPLTVRASGDASFATGTSNAVSMSVAPAATVTSMTTPSFATFPPQAGKTMSLRVRVVPQTTNTVDVQGSVEVFLDGVSAGVFAVDGSTDVTVTPQTGGEVAVRLDFTDSSASPTLNGSSFSGTVQVAAAPSTAPTLVWGGALRPGSAELAVTFPSAGSPNAPSGTLDILDWSGRSYGYAQMTGGHAIVPFFGHATTYSGLRLVYSGDVTNSAAVYFPPSVTIRPHESVTSLFGSPGSLERDKHVTLSATVTGVPAGTQGHVALLDGEDLVVSIPFTVHEGASASLTFSSGRLGQHSLRARFTPGDAVDVRGSDSAPSVVNVVDHAVPVLSISVPDQPLAGEPFYVTASAPYGQYGLRSGSTFTIFVEKDGSREALSGGALASGQYGYTARVQVPGLEAGSHTLVAVYQYGDYNQSATSSPVTFSIAKLPVFLRIENSHQTYGDLSKVTIEGYAPARIRSDLRTMTASVKVGSHPPRDVTLFLTGGGGGGPDWSGSFNHYIDKTGPFSISASTTGDGRSAGAGNASFGTVVQRRLTTMTLFDDEPDTIGRAPRRVRAQVSPIGGAFTTQPDPGAARVTTDGSYTECTTGGFCLLPQYAVPVGDSQVHGYYPGNENFFPSGASVDVHALDRRSSLSATFDPPSPSSWRTGEEIKVSWKVETSGAPARGRAVFSIGDSDCEGPALAGSCTVRVPTWNGDGPAPGPLDFVREYRPSDDAPTVRHVSPITPSSCVLVLAPQGHIVPQRDQDKCTAAYGQPGFVTGSEVKVVADLQAGYHVDSWLVDGEEVSDRDDATSLPEYGDYMHLKVTGNTSVSYTHHYAPVCLTLTMGNGLFSTHPALAGGSTYVHTKPNCASPSAPSAEELEAARLGYYRFAKGTKVQLIANPRNPYGAMSIADPAFAMDSWYNATQDPNPRYASLVMTDDTEAGAVFKVAHCVSTSVLDSDGGKVAVRESLRPESSQMLQPHTGACTDSDGQAGYVPGTKVYLDVAPNNDGTQRPPPERSEYFFEEVSLAHTAPPAKAHGQRAGEDSYRPTKTSAVIPVTPGRVGIAGQFGHVACTPFTTRLEIPSSATSPSITYSDAPNCPAKPETTSTAPIGGEFEARTKTVWFVEGSLYNNAVSASFGPSSAVVKYPRYWSVDPAEHRANWLSFETAQGPKDQEDRLSPVWGVSTYGGAARPVQPVQPSSQFVPPTTTHSSHYLSLAEGSNPVVVGRWLSTSLCRSLGLNAPTGGKLTQTPVTPQCLPGSYPNYVTQLELRVKGGPTSPLLTPFFSVPAEEMHKDSFNTVHYQEKATFANGRIYTDGAWATGSRGGDPMVVLNTANQPKIQLEFCARISYSVRTQDAAGVIAPLNGTKPLASAYSTHAEYLEALNRDLADDIDINSIIQTDGGCPKGWSRPNRTVNIGITEAADYTFEVLGPELHKPSSITVDAAGNPSRGVHYLLKAYCHNLTLGGRVAVQTAPNCPGGGDGQYVKGQEVHLEIDLKPGESFNSWSGADGTDGKTAFVAMVSDRHVGTDIDYPNDWEKAGAVLSSVAQRTLGLIATVTTGFILAQAAALAVTALAIKGIAALAGALGASGAVVQALTAAADYADAQLRIANATALCMSRWAAGGSGTLSQGDNTGGAATGAAGTVVSIGSSLYAGTKGASDASKAGIGAVANPVDWIDAYGSHADNYFQDPAEAWSSIGDIGTCIQAEIEGAQVSMGLRPAP